MNTIRHQSTALGSSPWHGTPCLTSLLLTRQASKQVRPAVPRTLLTCLLALAAVLGWAVEARTQDLAADKEALEALYNATSGDNWSNNTGWLSTEPVGDWHGVTVGNGRVTELRLSYNRLRGAIPAELGDLANLTVLSLTGNELTGTIPLELGNLSDLETIALAGNQLTGGIPTQLGNLSSLRTMYLNGNRLSGAIPPELGNLANLEELYLLRNGLTNAVPVQLGSLSNLTDLHLYDNQLTGPLPQGLTKLSLLEVFTFGENEGLCAPTNATFQRWLQDIDNTRGLAGVPRLGPNCDADIYTIPAKTTLTYPKAGSNLDDLIARVAAGEVEAEDAAAEAPLHRGDAVAVTIHLSGNVGGVASFLQSNGVTPRHQGEDYIEAFVPIRLLGTVSLQSGVLRMRMIQPAQENWVPNHVPGNGPGVHGSPAWNSAGYDGRGIKVGVIDAGFRGLSSLLGSELPATVQRRCYTGSSGSSTTNLADCETGSSHGTVVAESVLDIAPEVELSIANPLTQADLRDAVEWMALNGVKVINYSMTWFFDGPGDGTSSNGNSPLKTVDWAVDQGILWVNSAGNSAQKTWFKRAPFSPYVISFQGADATNAVVFPSSGGGFDAQLRWDDSWQGANRDLDLCIGDHATGAIVHCTSNPQAGVPGQIPFESVGFGSSSGGQYDLVVVRRGGTEPSWIQLTLWTFVPLEHRTENGSIGNPGESANSGMLTVGAASWNHVDRIDSYSSQGPTPDGRIKPDIVGAACGETETWSRDFCGTSQSSPHVAGMAALVLQRFPQATPAQVAAYLAENAEQRVPDPDPNNTWGHGFAVLPPISPHNISCTNGTTVPDPHNNPGLVRDCEALLAARDPLRGSASLNWAGDLPITMWQGIQLGGSPRRVTRLKLHNTKLTGAIPAELGSLSSLRELDLSTNQLTGTIPPQLSNLPSLEWLYLSSNQLTENIPIELGNLSNLDRMWLQENQLTGTIPPELGNLANLEGLYLFENRLTGSIPTRLGDLTKLRSLDLSENQLTGDIPAQLGKLSRLGSLNLSDNRLAGDIPAQLGALSNLGVLFLRGNQLTGTIPARLGDLIRLDWLWLENNQLTGSLPPQLGKLSSLRWLSLFNNQLTGTVPQAFTALGALERFYFNLNPGLCAQDSSAIRTWLNGVNEVRGPDCSPSVRLSVNPSRLWEGAGATPVTVTAERTAVGSNTQVDLIRGGSAEAGVGRDYTLDRSRLSIFIPANTSSGTTMLTITPLADNMAENDENIILEAVVGTKIEGSVTLPLVDMARACAARDRTALEAFYDATGGRNWATNTNWLSEMPLAKWHGVFVDTNGCVTRLDLRNNQLTGSIPTELDNLSSLRDLNLVGNRLMGSIPAQLGNLSSLQTLNLSDNQLAGTIPAELGNLANLEHLYLAGNELTGNIPPTFTRLGALTLFYFDRNAGLCAQGDAAIQTWLAGVADDRGPDCSSDETAKHSHFLPHIADGDGWQSTLLVTNVAQSASQCTLQLHGLGADRFESVNTVQVSGSTATFDLPGAGAYLTWPTRNQSPVASGYATLDCTEPVVAQVVFASIGSAGTPTGMATVFSSQAGTVFQFPVLTPEGTLGFAIANDTNAAADCRIVLEDPQRTNQGRAAFAVPSKSNWAGRLLDQILPIPTTFRGGTATVSCDQPVAMIGLHYELQPDRAIITFNTLPPAVLVPFSQSSDEAAKHSHFLPHIADGDGWQSTLLVTNVAQSASQCTLQLHGLGADRFESVNTVQVSGSTATFDLPGAGAYLTWPTRNQSPVASGYATLDCTEPVVAQVVFASIGSAGTPTGMATVFSSQAGTVFQFPVLTPEGTLGFAIANDTNAAADCRIVLEDPQRTNQGRAAFAVPSKSNWAGRLLDQILPIPTTFRGGTATVSCDQPVAMIGLHYELQPDRAIITFNTLPPAVLESTQVSQLEALEVLYHLARGSHWTKPTMRLTDTPLMEWPGVKIGLDGRVTGPNPQVVGLIGTISPEPRALANLTSLQLKRQQAEAIHSSNTRPLRRLGSVVPPQQPVE